MNRILDLQQKAKNLQEKHQRTIDEKLDSGMSQIFSDTQSTLNKKAQSLSTSIDSTNQNIQQQQSEATAQILQQITANTQQIIAKHQQTAKELLKVQQVQLEHLKVSLNELNDLSRETAEQVKLKKALFTSNIVLISVACIALISSICFGYVSKSKYNEINEMERKVEYLKTHGASMNIQKCGNEKDWKWCVQIDTKAPTYKNFMIVQETN